MTPSSKFDSLSKAKLQLRPTSLQLPHHRYQQDSAVGLIADMLVSVDDCAALVPRPSKLGSKEADADVHVQWYILSKKSGSSFLLSLFVHPVVQPGAVPVILSACREVESGTHKQSRCVPGNLDSVELHPRYCESVRFRLEISLMTSYTYRRWSPRWCTPHRPVSAQWCQSCSRRPSWNRPS